MTDEARDFADDTDDEVEFISAERLIFFSDAVAAIAITLLALALPPPSGVASGAKSITVLHALWHQRDPYLAFLISFLVIGRHWRSHHRLFRYVARLDSRIITLNMVWMLMIVITPYATRVLTGNGGFGVRFAFYAITQVVTILTVLLMGRHIRRSDLSWPGAPALQSESDDAGLLTVAAVFAISIPLAFITPWAFTLWVVSTRACRAVQEALTRHQKGTQRDRSE